MIIAALVTGGIPGARAAKLSAAQVNRAAWKRTVRSGSGLDPVVVRAQVLLDRRFLSPGAIDGAFGANVRKALVVFQNQKKLHGAGALDRQTWRALTKTDSSPVVKSYTISRKDVAGPFLKAMPRTMHQMAHVKRLGYTSARERLAERFHMGERLLRALNPTADFKKAGTKITVAAVAGRVPSSEISKIVVDRKRQGVKVYGKQGRLIAFYPATVGSGEFPSPTGRLKVLSVAEFPVFTLSGNLEYARKAKIKKGQKLKIPPGPNSPVGIVWIDLNKRGYGIHGTPNPELVSKRQSHGCVRLTNWDAMELARKAKRGTPVIFGG